MSQQVNFCPNHAYDSEKVGVTDLLENRRMISSIPKPSLDHLVGTPAEDAPSARAGRGGRGVLPISVRASMKGVNETFCINFNAQNDVVHPF